VASRMGRLMGKGGVVAFGVAKRVQLRHLHDVAVGAVKRPIAAVLNGRLRCRKETLGGFEARVRVPRFRPFAPPMMFRRSFYDGSRGGGGGRGLRVRGCSGFFAPASPRHALAFSRRSSARVFRLFSTLAIGASLRARSIASSSVIGFAVCDPRRPPTVKEQHEGPEYLPRHGLERLKQHRAAGGNRAAVVGGLSRIDLTCCWSEFRKW
jgi:hypothetical protein